jgi:hypothetical protein
MKINALLLSLLPMAIATSALANTVQINAGDDLVSKFATVQPGDQVTIGAGTFKASQPITVPSGVTITGQGMNSTYINFQLAGGDKNSYGFVLPANASNVIIQALDISSTNGVISMSAPGSYSGIQILSNNITHGAGQLSDGTLVFGICGNVSNHGLQIKNNRFHDTQGTVRSWSVWYASDANFDNNLFYNVNDGGQIDNPVGNCSFSNNYGTLVHRMGQECALSTATTKFTCNGNVFYDYYAPYNDTEGVSIVGATNEVDITNNYFRASIESTVPGGNSWGQADSGGAHRFGYAIECTGAPCNITGNTIIGPWADDVSATMPNASVSGNRIFGTTLWGTFDGEPGPDGYGSINVGQNVIDNNVGDAPAAPDNTATKTSAGPGYGTLASGSSGSGATGSSGSTSTNQNTGTSTGGSSGDTAPTSTTVNIPTPPNYIPVNGLSSVDANNIVQLPTNAQPLPITGVNIQVTSSTTATVTWTNPSPKITTINVNVISTVGRQNFAPAVLVNNGSTQITTAYLSALHPGWLIDFTVVAVDSSGQVYESKPVTASFPGNSVAPWQGSLWGGISTQQNDPYVQ